MTLALRYGFTAALLASVTLSAPTCNNITGPPRATIASGVLIGTQTALPSATAAVNKFLGIPFAQSPPERFSPPQSPQPWRSPLLVTEWKPACFQEFVCMYIGPFCLNMKLTSFLDPASARNFFEHIFNDPPVQESEDCLYLNVYAPATPAPRGGRTVMFWIFGGGLDFGMLFGLSFEMTWLRQHRPCGPAAI